MTDRKWKSLVQVQTVPWSSFNREEFVQFYWRVVAPVLDEEGHDPDEPVSAATYRELGFGHYIQAVRRHFDYSFKEFLAEEAGVIEPECPHEYNWPIEDTETKEWLDAFVLDLRKRDSTKQKESTIRRIAMNLYSFLQEWEAAHGSTAIIQILEDADNKEAYQLVLEVYDRLDDRVDSENTKCRYLKDHEYWFEFLTHPNNPLYYNPIPDVAERFRWSREKVDPMEREALSAEQVKRLWKHTESLEERMIIIAACAWGLRTGEIASLHVSELLLAPDDQSPYEGPVISFEERKMGPSAVNIIFGREVVESRITQLKNEYGDEWNGYLFPSNDRRSEHFSNKAIRKDRFQPLADRAGVTVDDQTPVLKHARRYWYQEYHAGITRYLQLVTALAEEQGSKDPEVVKRNYLGEIDQITFARYWMRGQLGKAFGGTELNKEPLTMDGSIIEVARDLVFDTTTPVEEFTQKNQPNSSWL